MTHTEIDQLLQRLGEQLAQGGCLKLGEHKIPVPDPVKVRLLQERGPRGRLILRLELEWIDEAPNGGSQPIAALLA